MKRIISINYTESEGLFRRLRSFNNRSINSCRSRI